MESRLACWCTRRSLAPSAGGGRPQQRQPAVQYPRTGRWCHDAGSGTSDCARRILELYGGRRGCWRHCGGAGRAERSLWTDNRCFLYVLVDWLVLLDWMMTQCGFYDCLTNKTRCVSDQFWFGETMRAVLFNYILTFLRPNDYSREINQWHNLTHTWIHSWIYHHFDWHYAIPTQFATITDACISHHGFKCHCKTTKIVTMWHSACSLPKEHVIKSGKEAL